jgi:hypothetical protein
VKLGRVTLVRGSDLSMLASYVGSQFRERFGFEVAWLGALHDLPPNEFGPQGNACYELAGTGIGWSTETLDPSCNPTPGLPTEVGLVGIFVH